jgi:PAS domain S-box-containing protein
MAKTVPPPPGFEQFSVDEKMDDMPDPRLTLAAIIDAADEAIVEKNLEGLIQSWNPAAERIFGFTAAEAIGQPVTMLIPPERKDEENIILEKVRSGERVHLETVRVTKFGEKFDASVTVAPVRDRAGKPVGAAKLLRNISEQKRADERLSGVSRRLMEAQEEERARIARELHDDIGQRLCVLGIQLASLAEDSRGVPLVSRRAMELQRQVSGIAAALQTLSHELHASKLELLGLPACIRHFCDEFSDQHKVTVHFASSDLPDPLPPSISLALFRILQEALHNSVKHGEAQQCGVQLRDVDGWIHLVVVDDGAGFDVEAAKRARGIGLVNMEERITLVDGFLSIKSEPRRGTTIHVRVPVAR